MTTVVLDTNIIVSAIIAGGNPRDVLELAIEGRITIAVTRDILDEIRGVLRRRKFNFSEQAIQAVMREIELVGVLVKPEAAIRAVRQDPDDDKFIECAVTARATCIVSGDSHLLNLQHYGGIAILSPADFLASQRTKQRT
ncbi:MAG: putative toxin-antitoxin system toxin component, PIN family [Deltaproteobacteria bacterium]|nr:putative toxin-antitoxin system toxin component, PIN family [Deltaproteobacteria bacterium]